MKATHIVFLVEEPSMEAFLRGLLPRQMPAECAFEIHPFQGKTDLLAKLQDRLRGYANWLPKDWRIVVLVDRDGDDCVELKRRLEEMAISAGLPTRSSAGAGHWKVVNRIAIEELEAWYFGDWQAVCKAFPRVSAYVPNQAGFRDPDAIRGGTWEAFERVLRRYGYFVTGFRKIEAAKAMGVCVNPERSRSLSFSRFAEAIQESIA